MTPFAQVLGEVFADGVEEVSVTDNINDESDSLTIRCENSTAMISTEEDLIVTVLAGYQEGFLWPLGSYALQSIQDEHLRETLTFTSAVFDDEMKKKRDLSYQKLTLKELIAKIAGRHSLTPKCDIDKQLKHIDQKGESDMALLRRLADKYNAIFNIKNGNLIFLSKQSDQLPVFLLFGSNAERYTFRHSRKTLYNSVKAQYHDPKKNKKIEIVVGDGKPEFVLTGEFKTEDEAKDAAQVKLDQSRAKSYTGTITMEGRNIIAGGVAICTGFGRGDGEYLITQATHRSGDRFTSEVTLEKR